MNKYFAVLLFYGISISVIFILSRISPTKQDGGPGLGDLAFLLFSVLIVGLFLFSIYKAITGNSSFYIIAGIHLLVMLYLLFFRFR